MEEIKLKISYSDKKEIESIISSFNEADNEIIYADVNRRYQQFKTNPLSHAMENMFENSQAYQLASDTIWWQDEIDKIWWNFTIKECQYEYALNIWRNKNEHDYDEVA